MSAGTVSDGGVVSTTVTLKLSTVALPAPSVAVTVTVVVPSTNVVPGACEYAIDTAETASVADATKVTRAPAALVASAVTSTGTVSDGAVVSTTTTRKLPCVALPAPSVAVTVTAVVPRTNVVPGACEYTIDTGE